MGLSVVIPVYNDAHNLVECLNSLLSSAKKAGTEIQVIVVDDGSNEDPAPYLKPIRKEHQNNDIKLIRLAENTGRYHARMVGAEQAGGDMLLLMDVRVRVPEDFIKTLAVVGRGPVIPYVNPVGEGWTARVMSLIRSRIYSASHGKLQDSGEILLTLENYESHLKGTTAVYVEKAVYLDAGSRVLVSGKRVHEESWLLKEIIRDNPIRITGELRVDYVGRDDLMSECVHLFQRGPRFAQYYMHSGTRFHTHLLLLVSLTVLFILSVLIHPPLLVVYMLASMLLLLVSAVSISESPWDVPKMVLVLPPLATCFTLGVLWGVIYWTVASFTTGKPGRGGGGM